LIDLIMILVGSYPKADPWKNNFHHLHLKPRFYRGFYFNLFFNVQCHFSCELYPIVQSAKYYTLYHFVFEEVSQHKIIYLPNTLTIFHIPRKFFAACSKKT
jgi:hypothetical protein